MIVAGFTFENRDGDRFTVEDIVIASNPITGATNETAIARSLDGTPAFIETSVLRHQLGKTVKRV